MAHLLYIPLTIAIGIYIGHRLGRHSERREQQKKQKLQRIRDQRKTAPSPQSDR